MVHLFEALKAVGEVTLALTRRVAVPHDDQLSHEVAWRGVGSNPVGCVSYLEGSLATLSSMYSHSSRLLVIYMEPTQLQLCHIQIAIKYNLTSYILPTRNLGYDTHWAQCYKLEQVSHVVQAMWTTHECTRCYDSTPNIT